MRYCLERGTAVSSHKVGFASRWSQLPLWWQIYPQILWACTCFFSAAFNIPRLCYLMYKLQFPLEGNLVYDILSTDCLFQTLYKCILYMYIFSVQWFLYNAISLFFMLTKYFQRLVGERHHFWYAAGAAKFISGPLDLTVVFLSAGTYSSIPGKHSKRIPKLRTAYRCLYSAKYQESPQSSAYFQIPYLIFSNSETKQTKTHKFQWTKNDWVCILLLQ